MKISDLPKLLKQSDQIQSDIQSLFSQLTIKEKLRFTFDPEFTQILSRELKHSQYIPDSIDSILIQFVPSGKHRRFDLVWFVDFIIEYYIELNPDFENLEAMEFINTLITDVDFMETNPSMKVVVKMLEENLGSFCYSKYKEK